MPQLLRKVLGVRLGEFAQYEPKPIRSRTLATETPLLGSGPQFSIVTPVFNQQPFIEATLSSVLDQTYPRVQYIVMDGGSTDGTWEVIERYRQRLSYAQSAPDNGQAHAINQGLAHATGEIMGWINGDDLLLPGALAYVARYFDSHPGVDVVYGHRVVIDSNGLETGRWVMPPHFGKALSWADYVPQETLFWRRRIFEKIGGQVDESFQFALDWDLLLRFRDVGAKFVRLPRYLGAFRVHATQKTTAAWLTTGLEESNRILCRCHGRVPSTFEKGINLLPFLLSHGILQRLDRWLDLY